MKVSQLTRISSPAPEICSNFSHYRGCPQHENSIPVLPWPNGTAASFKYFRGYGRTGV